MDASVKFLSSHELLPPGESGDAEHAVGPIWQGVIQVGARCVPPSFFFREIDATVLSMCGRRSFPVFLFPPPSFPLRPDLLLDAALPVDLPLLAAQRLSTILTRAPVPDQGGVDVQGGVRPCSPWRSGRSGTGTPP